MNMKRVEVERMARKYREEVEDALWFADTELTATGFYRNVPYRSSVRGHVRRARRWLRGEAVALTSGAVAQLKWALRDSGRIE